MVLTPKPFLGDSLRNDSYNWQRNRSSFWGILHRPPEGDSGHGGVWVPHPAGTGRKVRGVRSGVRRMERHRTTTHGQGKVSLSKECSTHQSKDLLRTRASVMACEQGMNSSLLDFLSSNQRFAKTFLRC